MLFSPLSQQITGVYDRNNDGNNGRTQFREPEKQTFGGQGWLGGFFNELRPMRSGFDPCEMKYCIGQLFSLTQPYSFGAFIVEI